MKKIKGGKMKINNIFYSEKYIPETSLFLLPPALLSVKGLSLISLC